MSDPVTYESNWIMAQDDVDTVTRTSQFTAFAFHVEGSGFPVVWRLQKAQPKFTFTFTAKYTAFFSINSSLPDESIALVGTTLGIELGKKYKWDGNKVMEDGATDPGSVQIKNEGVRTYTIGLCCGRLMCADIVLQHEYITYTPTQTVYAKLSHKNTVVGSVITNLRYWAKLDVTPPHTSFEFHMGKCLWMPAPAWTVSTDPVVPTVPNQVALPSSAPAPVSAAAVTVTPVAPTGAAPSLATNTSVLPPPVAAAPANVPPTPAQGGPSVGPTPPVVDAAAAAPVSGPKIVPTAFISLPPSSASVSTAPAPVLAFGPGSAPAAAPAPAPAPVPAPVSVSALQPSAAPASAAFSLPVSGAPPLTLPAHTSFLLTSTMPITLTSASSVTLTSLAPFIITPYTPGATTANVVTEMKAESGAIEDTTAEDSAERLSESSEESGGSYYAS